MVAGEGGVPDVTFGRGRHAVGSGTARRFENSNLARFWVELSIEAGKTGEPKHLVAVERRRVEIGVIGCRGQAKQRDLGIGGVDARNGVLTAVGDPGRAIWADDHAMGRGPLAEIDDLDGSAVWFETSDRTAALACEPHHSAACWRDVMHADA